MVLVYYHAMQEPFETTKTFYYERPVLKPTALAWAKHLALLLLTLLTATVAGSIFPFGPVPFNFGPDPETWSEIITILPQLPYRYLAGAVDAVTMVFSNWEYLSYGLSFSLSLLFILTSHEMGHYIACRIYKVDATLPYFIPMPPMIGPAGTFGAFIKIVSPFPSRRSVFDIGVAGPIAGFIAMLPIAVLGVAMAKQGPPIRPEAGSIIFSEPLLLQLIAVPFGIDLSFVYGNPFLYAAWIGALVTALNLIPSGQLDGGHVIYAVFGERVHWWTGRIAFVLMASFSVIGLVYFNSPSGFLIAILLGIMMRIRHPEPWDNTPLDAKRIIIAIMTLLIFALCFVPFPITIA